jgi:hypothetical protein
MTSLYISLPPLRASRQDADNARPSIDSFEQSPPPAPALDAHTTGIPWDLGDGTIDQRFPSSA